MVKGASPFLSIRKLVSLSNCLSICWAMSRCCCRRVREEKILLTMYLLTGLVRQLMMIGWRSLCLRICLRRVHCCSGSTADLVEREEAIL